MGQPTLSTQLKQLEDSVGRPLFERKNRSLVLTEAGKIALDYAENIFRTGEELLQVASFFLMSVPAALLREAKAQGRPAFESALCSLCQRRLCK